MPSNECKLRQLQCKVVPDLLPQNRACWRPPPRHGANFAGSKNDMNMLKYTRNLSHSLMFIDLHRIKRDGLPSSLICKFGASSLVKNKSLSNPPTSHRLPASYFCSGCARSPACNTRMRAAKNMQDAGIKSCRGLLIQYLWSSLRNQKSSFSSPTACHCRLGRRCQAPCRSAQSAEARHQWN